MMYFAIRNTAHYHTVALKIKHWYKQAGQEFRVKIFYMAIYFKYTQILKQKMFHERTNRTYEISRSQWGEAGVVQWLAKVTELM